MAAKLSACTKCTFLRRESKPQTTVYHLLAGLGRRYRERRVGLWRIDLVLQILSPKMNIAIEYDGWHHHKNRLEKDERKRRKLRALGYVTLRIKGNQLVPSREQLQHAINILTRASAISRLPNRNLLK